MTEPVKVRLSLEFDYGSTEVEIPRAKWDKMNNAQRREYLDKLADGIVYDYVSPCWEILSEGDRLDDQDDY